MAKELPALKKGDRVELTVNDQNLLVDVHLAGESSYHRVAEGQLVQPLVTGHDRAVFRTTRGQEESLLFARSRGARWRPFRWVLMQCF
jgi:hypothetical protein